MLSYDHLGQFLSRENTRHDSSEVMECGFCRMFPGRWSVPSTVPPIFVSAVAVAVAVKFLNSPIQVIGTAVVVCSNPESAPLFRPPRICSKLALRSLEVALISLRTGSGESSKAEVLRSMAEVFRLKDAAALIVQVRILREGKGREGNKI